MDTEIVLIFQVSPDDLPADVKKSRSEGAIIIPSSSSLIHHQDRGARQSFQSFPSIQTAAVRNSQSACVLHPSPTRDVKLRYYSVPNLNKQQQSRDSVGITNGSKQLSSSNECNIPNLPRPNSNHSLSSGFSSMRVSAAADNSDADSVSDITLIPNSTASRTRLRALFSDNQDSAVADVVVNASAVNLKTGASVFSLDLSSPSATNTQQKSLRARSAKRSIKSSKSVGRDKQRMRSGLDDSDLGPSLSVTPMSTTPRVGTPEKSADSLSGEEEVVYGTGIEEKQTCDRSVLYLFHMEQK